MKTTRILVILTLALAICATAAFARGKGPYSNLNLTPDQKAQIRAIHQEQHAQMQDLSKKSLTRQEFRTQAMAIRHSSDERVSSILTPDQRARLQAERAKHPSGPRGEMRRQPPQDH